MWESDSDSEHEDFETVEEQLDEYYGTRDVNSFLKGPSGEMSGAVEMKFDAGMKCHIFQAC